MDRKNRMECLASLRTSDGLLVGKRTFAVNSTGPLRDDRNLEHFYSIGESSW